MDTRIGIHLAIVIFPECTVPCFIHLKQYVLCPLFYFSKYIETYNACLIPKD